jgi:hypothetical protein
MFLPFLKGMTSWRSAGGGKFFYFYLRTRSWRCAGAASPAVLCAPMLVVASHQ